MSDRKIVSISVTLAALVLIALVSIALIHRLDARANQAYDHEITLANLTAKTNRISVLEWQMIAASRADNELLAAARAVRAEIDVLQARHEGFRHETGVAMDTSEIIDRYLEAIDRRLDLMAAGEPGEILRANATVADPLYVQFSEAVALEARQLNEAYSRAHRLVFVGSAVITVAALVIISVLLWRLNIRQRSAQLLAAEKAIVEESEERFRAVAQSVPDAVISINSIGRITFWNHGAERIFGYKMEEVVGHPLTMIMPEDLYQRHKAALGHIISGSRPQAIGKTVEYTGKRRDGNEFPVELSLSSWTLGDEQYFTSVLRDVSERREIDNKLQAQSAELEKRNIQLWALYEASSMINNEDRLDVLFDRMLEKITRMELFNVERKGGIFLIEGDEMRLAAWLNHSDAFLKCHKHLKVGTCLCGIAAASGKTIISLDSEKDSRHQVKYPGMKSHGHVVVPLVSGEDVLGVLYLYLPAGTKMPENDLNMLAALSNQLAVAIERNRLFEETRRLSLYDPLTGLANRHLMNVELSRSSARAKRTGEPLSLLMLDLDRFKEYNDSFGHTAGDKLLKEIAQIMQGQLREVDLAVRYGGEEFLIILPDTTLERAAMVAERIRHEVEQADFFHADDAGPAHVTISIGATSTDASAPNENVLISRADDALYEAKNSGRNRVVIWSRGLEAA